MRLSTRSGTSGYRGRTSAMNGPSYVDLVHRRHVDAGDRRELAQHALAPGPPAALPRADDLGDLADGLLAVADHERVDEVGHRLGVERAVPAGDTSGCSGRRCSARTGTPGEVEAVQQVRVDELGREVEGEHVEVAGGAVGVDREERHARRPHLGLEVDPGRVGALGDGVVAFVEDLVEDLEPLVGQPDLVGVGIDEQPGGAGGRCSGCRLPRSIPM